ncbi:MAG: FAD-binding domain [Kofleriaceae bacterium]|nr:FAD-binding domain [Kofleriaceae bacterium]
MNVLIAGAGIGGPTLAYWLRRAGYEITIVERSPELRRGGYIVDFWGAGFDVADQMGIVPELTRAGYHLGEIRQVGDDGRKITSFDPELFVRGTGGRYVSIARSDLAAIIYGALDGRVETLFGDSVRALDDDGARVRVTFESGTTRDFDLVVGADGLHSQVRHLVFGPEEQFEKFLGITVAAFDIEGYRPRDELVAVMHTQVGYQVTRLALRDDITMFLVTFVDDGSVANQGVNAQQAALRARLAGAGWEIPEIIEGMSAARTFYCDRVSQIRMPSWTRGRVALLGDAAACVSLLAGQGSALAMVEAYVLAAELARAHGNHTEAFARYEQQLAPFLVSKQEAAIKLAPAFAPRSRLQLFLRNSIMKMFGLPFVAKLAMGKSLRDAIELPPPAAA